MSKVQLTKVSPGVWFSDCGRLFKEFKYDLRGSKNRRYKTVIVNGKKIDLHRYIAEKLIPNPENKPWVLHNDDDPTNNQLSNLRWGTPKENSADAMKNGRFKKNAMRRKKHRQEVYETLLEMKKQGLNNRQITKLIPVSESRISQMVKKLRDDGHLI